MFKVKEWQQLNHIFFYPLPVINSIQYGCVGYAWMTDLKDFFLSVFRTTVIIIVKKKTKKKNPTYLFNIFKLWEIIEACWESQSWYFSDMELLALFVSSLGHDLDHRGTNNQYQMSSVSKYE